jgi:hypothetical protein
VANQKSGEEAKKATAQQRLNLKPPRLAPNELESEMRLGAEIETKAAQNSSTKQESSSGGR